MIIHYIAGDSRNAEVPWSKMHWFFTSHSSKRGEHPALWPFPITPNPTSLNLSGYTALGYEQEPAFPSAASSIHDCNQIVFRPNNSFGVPHSPLKSLCFSKRSGIFVAGFSRKKSKGKFWGYSSTKWFAGGPINCSAAFRGEQAWWVDLSQWGNQSQPWKAELC